MKAARISRVRGVWLAGLVALSLLTFGIVPHGSASASGHTTNAPVAAAGGHLDQVVLTRTPSAHLVTLKSPVSYGDLAVAAAVLCLAGWLLTAGAAPGSARSSRLLGARLSRAPPPIA